MRPLAVLVPLLVIGAAAALLFVGDSDEPGGVDVVSDPVGAVTPTPEETAPTAAAGLDAPLAPNAPAAVVREAVVLTEDGDVADLPPESMRTDVLRVRVEDELGRALDGARVSLAAGFPGKQVIPVPFVDFEAEESADADGVATFRVPPVGVYTVHAAHDGFAGEDLGPVVAGDEVTLRLAPGETLVGRVEDATTAQGVEEARVRLERGGETFEASSDADGTFAVTDLAAGTYRLRVVAAGFDLLVQDKVVVPPESGALALTMTPGLRLSGVVVARGTDEPVAGAEVALEGGDAEDEQLLPAPVVTAADGSFGFDAPVSRRGLRLVVTSPGFATERRGVKGKSDAPALELRIELFRGATVAGRVTTAAGAAAKDARVRLRGFAKEDRRSFDVRTDGDGAFAFEGVRPGRKFTLLAGDPESGFAPANLEALVVEEGDDLVGLEVVLAHGGRLDGEVRDGAGAPVAHARVLVDGLDAETWKALEQKPVLFTDEEGRFALAGLPEAELEVAAEHQGWTAPPSSLAVVPGGEHVLTLTLDEGARLEGVVVDTRGAPVDDALVTAHAVQPEFQPPSSEQLGKSLRSGDGNKGRGGGRGGGGRRGGRANPGDRILRAATGGREKRLTAFRTLARSDAQGRFVLKGLRADETLALVVRKEGHLPRHEFGVEPARGGVRIVLPALVTLTGHVVDASTRRPLPSFQVHAEPVTAETGGGSVGALLAAPSARRRGFRSDDGAFELRGMQPGSWMVSVSAKDYRRSEPLRVEIAPGLTGDVLLAATPASVVRAHVRARSGGAILGISVTLRPASGKGRALRRTTDGHGRAVFVDAPPGEYVLLAGVARKPVVGPVPVEVEEGESVSRELLTDGVGGLSVDVRSGSGFGIPKAKVRVRGLTSGIRRTVRANARGVAWIEGLLEEEVQVTASAKQHQARTEKVTVRAGGAQELTLHLTEQP